MNRINGKVMFCLVAHPSYFFDRFGWVRESDDSFGEYKTKRDSHTAYYWNDDISPYSEPHTMLLNVGE